MTKDKDWPGGWGIVRYLVMPGVAPYEDPCAFDGWYTERAMAQQIYAMWCKEYPNWIVALVAQRDAHFPDMCLQALASVREHWLDTIRAFPK